MSALPPTKATQILTIHLSEGGALAGYWHWVVWHTDNQETTIGAGIEDGPNAALEAAKFAVEDFLEKLA